MARDWKNPRYGSAYPPLSPISTPQLTHPPADIWSEDAAEEEMLCNGPRFHTGNPKKILLYLTKDSSSTPLKVTVQAYRPHGEANEAGGLRLADFPRDEVPSHGQLQGWVEEEIKREGTKKFRLALQSFMLAYSLDGEGLPRVSNPCLDYCKHAVNF